MGDIHLFFPKEHNVVNKFTPFVFYEGIQFNNFTPTHFNRSIPYVYRIFYLDIYYLWSINRK